jgi:hypothetical protein
VTARYAASTSVPVERSEQEIKRTLQRYGATRIGIMSEPKVATLYFTVKDREIQLKIPIPVAETLVDGHKYRKWTKPAAAQEERRRWRVMVLTLKAMLEAVESHITTFDEVFLAHVVMPGTGRTIGDLLVPKLNALYSGQSLPSLLAERNP